MTPPLARPRGKEGGVGRAMTHGLSLGPFRRSGGALLPRYVDLGDRVLDRSRNVPARVMTFDPGEVGVITDVISVPILLDIFVFHLASRELLADREGLDNGN